MKQDRVPQEAMELYKICLVSNVNFETLTLSNGILINLVVDLLFVKTRGQRLL